mmetsp:Transcript_48961/g.156767  ORF Transcript_48961/g.156767 Transcript_48961/m.156767 type:complete len:226 (+) Transcript_48961:350-1027(+)
MEGVPRPKIHRSANAATSWRCSPPILCTSRRNCSVEMVSCGRGGTTPSGPAGCGGGEATRRCTTLRKASSPMRLSSMPSTATDFHPRTSCPSGKRGAAPYVSPPCTAAARGQRGCSQHSSATNTASRCLYSRYATSFFPRSLRRKTLVRCATRPSISHASRGLSGTTSCPNHCRASAVASAARFSMPCSSDPSRTKRSVLKAATPAPTDGAWEGSAPSAGTKTSV